MRVNPLVVALSAALLVLLAGCSSIERKLLFIPSHHPFGSSMAPWIVDGAMIGCFRGTPAPHAVWLMLHGNAGQAEDREYALRSFPATDAVFILEYPGYGLRQGSPSRESLNNAAKEAYQSLRGAFPKIPVCVVGESIGSGPACSLARLSHPPDKLVLVVPFDTLESVAKDHMASALVAILLSDNWDNVAALHGYKGPIDIFGAAADTVIPLRHAKALAASHPGARFNVIEGGHNEWSQPGRVQITFP
jgi:uncharacterized protein